LASDKFLVLSLAHFADLLQLGVAQGFARIAERCKRILRLTCLDNVSHESEEVTLTGGVSEIARNSHCLADDRFRNTSLGAEGMLIFLEHALMLPHLRDDTRAKIAIADVIRLTLVVFEILEQRAVLHRRVADLAFEELESFVHGAP